jgi:hypothetical protein
MAERADQSHARGEIPFEDVRQAPSPPGDWTRKAGEAFAEGSAFEALRDHLSDGDTECLEWCPICRAADILRANSTPELREQWASVQREALMTIRTLIDHYLERVDSEAGDAGPRVQDIPID